MQDVRRSLTAFPPTELSNEVTTMTLDPIELRALVKPNGAHVDRLPITPEVVLKALVAAQS